MMRVVRPVVTAVVLIAAWQVLVWGTGVPRFILPDPIRVAAALYERADIIGYHAMFTVRRFWAAWGSASCWVP